PRRRDAGRASLRGQAQVLPGAADHRVQRPRRARGRESHDRGDPGAPERARRGYRAADQPHAVPRPDRRLHRHGIRLGALREDGLRRQGCHDQPGAPQLSHPGLRGRASQRGLLRRHVRRLWPPGGEGSGRVRDKPRCSGDLERGGPRHGRTLRPSTALAGTDLRPARRPSVSDNSGGTAAGTGGVTVITQTRARPDAGEAYARWQDETSRVVARFPGFIKQTVLPPGTPQQVEWVILQQFADEPQAMAWLKSEERQNRANEVAPMLVGVDDIHLVHDSERGAQPAPVSAVISSRIAPGQEPAYRRWEQRIAAAQATAPGFQG